MISNSSIVQSFLSMFDKLDFSDKSLLPSEFAEKYIILDSSISSLKQGKFSYKLTPYLKEVVDCASPYNPTKIIVVKKGAQIGFAIQIDADILTINGWCKFGDLKQGDFVYGDDGLPTKVLYATDTMYNHDCYEVEFDNGEKIIADKDHLWEVVFDTVTFKKDIVNTGILESGFYIHRKYDNELFEIISVTKVDSVPVRCISVDNESKLFLIGKSLIPTHNSQGVIVPAILWKIANDPGNIVSLSANDDMSKEFVEKRIDPIIQRCYVKDLIRPSAIRKRNQRTGDTSKSKEYAGGSAVFGGLQSIDKLGKQRSFSLGFLDDWDGAKVADETQGNIFELIMQRFSTSVNNMKMFFISTPEVDPSNIDILYERGDKRKWHVPCPCCGDFIELLWHQKLEDGTIVGVIFEKNEDGTLIESSVMYRCQKCKQTFTEKHKEEMNLHGKWIPSVVPKDPDVRSYHITCLCAAPGMFDWKKYAKQWCRIYEGGKEDKASLKVFKNTVLGEVWHDEKITINSDAIQGNTRNYEVGEVPSLLSENDGNDKIVLLTFACDCNGTENDARIDWEVLAHSCSGSTYSIDQGSIGTYRRGSKAAKERDMGKRDLWTYRHDEPLSVWDSVSDILYRSYTVDDGREMKVAIAGIDSGHLPHFVYTYVEKHNNIAYAFKGKDVDKFIRPTQDLKRFEVSNDRSYLYLLTVHKYKDEVSESLNLTWDQDLPQPEGYCNFPTPNYQQKKYTLDFFNQLSSEHKEIKIGKKTGIVEGYKWDKKTADTQNHFWDVRIYNMAAKDIIVDKFFREYNRRNANKQEPTWYNFVELIKVTI